MVDVLVLVYVCGCLLVTGGAYVAARRLNDRREPAQHPLVVSLIAGAVWPLLLVGLVELSSVLVITKAHSKVESGVGIFA